MKDNINHKFELHKKWIETIGKEGKKLVLDEFDLRNYNLSEKLLEQAYLIDCIFDNSNLENIDFYASVLCSSTYKDAKLKNCDFYKSDLSYVNFSNAIIKRVRFSKSDCSEAIFTNADLTECKLINACLYLTDFSNAKLDNIDISGSTFDETLLKGATLRNIKGIEEAHFQSINIGTLENAIILKSEQAKKWIIENCFEDRKHIK